MLQHTLQTLQRKACLAGLSDSAACSICKSAGRVPLTGGVYQECFMYYPAAVKLGALGSLTFDPEFGLLFVEEGCLVKTAPVSPKPTPLQGSDCLSIPFAKPTKPFSKPTAESDKPKSKRALKPSNASAGLSAALPSLSTAPGSLRRTRFTTRKCCCLCQPNGIPVSSHAGDWQGLGSKADTRQHPGCLQSSRETRLKP